MNKVVARYQDGQILKGMTNDFLPTKNDFHLFLDGAPPGSKPVLVRVTDLKGVFFVKDYAGDPKHQESNTFSASGKVTGRKIRVLFKDGEALVGTTQGYDRSRPGFFVVPADAESNNERVFVVAAATQEVSFL
jgi:hypothetical protein